MNLVSSDVTQWVSQAEFDQLIIQNKAKREMNEEFISRVTKVLSPNQSEVKDEPLLPKDLTHVTCDYLRWK